LRLWNENTTQAEDGVTYWILKCVWINSIFRILESNCNQMGNTA